MKNIVAVFALCASCFAGQLTGQVSDAAGAQIPLAHIVIHWDSAGIEGMKQNIGISEDKSLKADKRGRFALELPTGAYDVFITAPGFEPTCEKLAVIEGQTIHDDVHLKLSTLTIITVD